MNRYIGYTLDDCLKLKPKNSRLTPIMFGKHYVSPGGHKRKMLICRCDCGKKHSVDITYFKNGKILSCGCYNLAKGEELAFTLDKINSFLPKNNIVKAVKFSYKYRFPSGQQTRHYMFLCCCGKKFVTSASRVLSGNTKSCGCAQKKFPDNRRHLTQTYHNLITRCYKKDSRGYLRYGARGVRVCKEWRGKSGLNNFYNWAINNGWQHGLQLDKDIIGNGKLYSPKTCCWVTSEVNCNHRSVTRRFDYMGTKYSTRDLCNMFKLKYKQLYPLLVRMPAKEAITWLKKKIKNK